MAKAKKAKTGKAKKSKAKKTKKSANRTAAKVKASRGKTKKSKPRWPKKVARKATKPNAKTAAPKKKQSMGEGDYQASRRFLKDESDFVKRHTAEIPAMGKDAERALEGPEGCELLAAEEEARSHSSGR